MIVNNQEKSKFCDFSYVLVKKHAVHVAIIADIPIKIADITNHVPGDRIIPATAKFLRTEHESTTLTEYLEYVSSRFCRISSESIIFCISCGGKAAP